MKTRFVATQDFSAELFGVFYEVKKGEEVETDDLAKTQLVKLGLIEPSKSTKKKED